MQRNLKRGLSLTFSLVLLTVVLAACNKAPSGHSQSQAQTEAPATHPSFHRAGHESTHGTLPKLKQEDQEVSASESAVAGKNVSRRSTAQPQQDSASIDLEADPFDAPSIDSGADDLDRVATTSKRLPINVPPPPLGIVPAGPRSSGKTQAMAQLNDSRADNHIAAPPARKSSQSSKVTTTRTASAGRDDFEEPPRPRAISGKHNPQRPVSRQTSSRNSTSDVRSSEDPDSGTGSRTSTGRRRELTEQELRAQKLVHERAAFLAKQRQARLAARRGTSSRYNPRSWAHTAQNRPEAVRHDQAVASEAVFIR